MRLDRDTELQHLNEAETHICDAERRIATLAEHRDRLRADGHDTREAQRLVVIMEDVLATLRAHRSLIVDQIGRIDAGEV